MIDPSSTVAKLVALANDEAGALEERRTAAMQAAAMMRKHSLAPVSSTDGASTHTSDPLSERIDRLHRMAERQDQTAATRAVLNGVFERLWEHYPRAEHCAGRAELSMLLRAAVRMAYQIAIDPERTPQREVAEFLDALPTVVGAFDAWSEQQPVPHAEQVQTSIMETYGQWREPLPCHDSIACALHVPAPAVVAAIDALVEGQKLRRKPGQRIEVVRRRPKPKSQITQEDLFHG